MPDNSLLDFILDLLSDHEAAEAFYADPDGALKSAGLAGFWDRTRHVCVGLTTPRDVKPSPSSLVRHGNHGSS